jgi:hypothetical protein
LKRPGRPDLDPAVLAELRQKAAIREHPFALLHAQYVSLHNQYASLAAQEGDLVAPMKRLRDAWVQNLKRKFKNPLD